jgi:hypothetical protein
LPDLVDSAAPDSVGLVDTFTHLEQFDPTWQMDAGCGVNMPSSSNRDAINNEVVSGRILGSPDCLSDGGGGVRVPPMSSLALYPKMDSARDLRTLAGAGAGDRLYEFFQLYPVHGHVCVSARIGPFDS